MKYEIKLRRTNIPEEELLIDVRRVANELNKNTVSIHEYEQEGCFDAQNIARRFRSWNKMLIKAKLEIGLVVNISDEELYRNLEEVWTKLGRQPARREMKAPVSKYSESPYLRRFGNWNNTLKAFIEYVNQDQNETADNGNQNNNDMIKVQFGKPIKRTRREISDRLRFRILLRDGFTCRKCGRSPLKSPGVELHVDHVVPWSKGGETTPENLETKCKKCNLGKGNAFNV